MLMNPTYGELLASKRLDIKWGHTIVPGTRREARKIIVAAWKYATDGLKPYCKVRVRLTDGALWSGECMSYRLVILRFMEGEGWQTRLASVAAHEFHHLWEFTCRRQEKHSERDARSCAKAFVAGMDERRDGGAAVNG